MKEFLCATSKRVKVVCGQHGVRDFTEIKTVMSNLMNVF